MYKTHCEGCGDALTKGEKDAINALDIPPLCEFCEHTEAGDRFDQEEEIGTDADQGL